MGKEIRYKKIQKRNKNYIKREKKNTKKEKEFEFLHEDVIRIVKKVLHFSFNFSFILKMKKTKNSFLLQLPGGRGKAYRL